MYKKKIKVNSGRSGPSDSDLSDHYCTLSDHSAPLPERGGAGINDGADVGQGRRMVLAETVHDG